MKRKKLSCFAAVIIAASILALSAAGPKIRDMLSPAVDCVIPELSNTETGVAYKLPKEFLGYRRSAIAPGGGARGK